MNSKSIKGKIVAHCGKISKKLSAAENYKDYLGGCKRYNRELLVNLGVFAISSALLSAIFISLFFIEKDNINKKNKEELTDLSKRIFTRLDIEFYKIAAKLKKVAENTSNLEECNANAKNKPSLQLIGSYNIYCQEKKDKFLHTNIILHKNYHRDLEIRYSKEDKNFESVAYLSVRELVKNLNLTTKEYSEIVLKILSDDIGEVLFPSRDIKNIINKVIIPVNLDISLELGQDKEIIEKNIKDVRNKKIYLFLSIQFFILLMYCLLKNIYKKFLFSEMNMENKIFREKALKHEKELKILKELKERISQSYIEQIKYYGIMHDQAKIMLLNALGKIEGSNDECVDKNNCHIFDLIKKSSEGALYNVKEIFSDLLKLISYNAHRKNLKITERLDIRDQIEVSMNRYTFYMILYSITYILFRSVRHDAKISILVTENSHYLKFKFVINENVHFIDLDGNSSVFVNLNKINSLLEIHDGEISIENVKNKTIIEINIFKNKNFKKDETENVSFINTHGGSVH